MGGNSPATADMLTRNAWAQRRGRGINNASDKCAYKRSIDIVFHATYLPMAYKLAPVRSEWGSSNSFSLWRPGDSVVGRVSAGIYSLRPPGRPPSPFQTSLATSNTTHRTNVFGTRFGADYLLAHRFARTLIVV